MSIARLMQQAAAGSAGAGPDPSGWTDPDLGNASYDSVSFSVAGQDGAPWGVFFKTDGSKMYVTGGSGDDINEYDLSTAWEISTASYVQNYSVSAQDTGPRSAFFKPDGTKMYFVGSAGDDINEYNLSTAWDVSSSSFVQVFSVAAQDSNPSSVYFKDDGSKMYVLGRTGTSVYEYDLSTSWDVSSASFLQSFSVSSQETGPNALFFGPNGDSFFVTGNIGDDVNEYTLTTAWDISTASYVQAFSVASQETFPTGLFFKSDGSKMYVVGLGGTSTIYQYSTAAAAPAEWTDPDLANASYDSVSFSVSGQDTIPVSLFFSASGDKLFVLGNSNDAIFQYSLTTAYDLSTASYDSVSFSVSSQETAVSCLAFSDDGTLMYISGSGTDSVFQYTLSTAWDLSTASYASKSFSASSQDTAIIGLSFSASGDTMYLSGGANDTIFQYSLSTPWDISTASYASKSYNASALDGNPRQHFWSPTGDKLWFLGLSTDAVYELDLSTGFDISTAAYNSVSFSVASQDATPLAVFFKSDGAKMYVLGIATDTIYQYSTA